MPSTVQRSSYCKCIGLHDLVRGFSWQEQLKDPCVSHHIPQGWSAHRKEMHWIPIGYYTYLYVLSMHIAVPHTWLKNSHTRNSILVIYWVTITHIHGRLVYPIPSPFCWLVLTRVQVNFSLILKTIPFQASHFILSHPFCSLSHVYNPLTLHEPYQAPTPNSCFPLNISSSSLLIYSIKYITVPF